ncbi:hypothetical protein STSP2_00850 [Anaerohalosphaera lusitana]|uniref:DUF883 domain-containing protein n=1 Tax=Anaerohalosphaera lusitana TaxID=1936003 RepID=A0A1U9NID5_9BACT|nr:DUF883 family protein [Anaerohalosphaera lusitana]AQT67702.1 hypothetical protein STSP2_00850 [Anaerohalosphaera lusitana]
MATERTKEINREVEQLKNDIRKLRSDLTEMLGSVGGYSQEKVMRSRNKLKEAMADLEGRTKERFDHAQKAVREHGDEALNTSRKYIEKKPLASVLISFAVGIVVAGILGRRSS